jgi:signal-transduction protein with cAMP-binding, CBS, and nucleotidyltransferase domain
MKTVKDIFESKQKSFNYTTPDARVYDALVQLNSVNLSYLVVMDHDEYKGIFSEKDYTRNVILKGRASNSTAVSEVMTTDIPMVSMEDTAEQCMHLVNAHKTRYLLAYDNQQFVGVITINDLLRLIIASKEQVFDNTLAASLLDYDDSEAVL